MKSTSHLFVLLFVSLSIILEVSKADLNDDTKLEKYVETISLRGLSRYLAQHKLQSNNTCDKFSRVCRQKGSAGPDCCKKKCVNVKTDHLNCGMCGYKCKYEEICCGGKCVNASFDRKNCGGCHHKCKKGDLCAYGMCSYG
ncbi:hypothetical protein ACJIZ3_006646 [Penstemon smallii]|uniref:Stigma-specific STIG1-like protein 1 n=1 Tax=Penstemon smallii TaxID=265156 RepID=A0ABD3S8H1_9LAMI